MMVFLTFSGQILKKTFIEEKRVETRLWQNVHFCGEKEIHHQPASARCGAAPGAELAGADHFHLYALRAAARQPAWVGCGAAAGWELDVADHLCALLAAVRRMASAGCRGDTVHSV